MTMPAAFWIFVLLANLLPAFRESLLLHPNGTEWTVYEELRTFVLNKWNAQKSAQGSTKDSKADPKNADKSGSNPKLPPRGGRPTGSRPNGRNADTAPRQDAGAGPSDPNANKKRKTSDQGCFGCGSNSHKIGDKHADGTAVCPLFDEARFRKGKYPTKAPKKGNGQGK